MHQIYLFIFIFYFLILVIGLIFYAQIMPK